MAVLTLCISWRAEAPPITGMNDSSVAGMFALERGGTVSHLHLQGILRMQAKTVRGITAAIKRHLHWDEGRQPPGSRVMCRGLTGNRLHTWAGLVGYCCKDMHEPHFQVCCHHLAALAFTVGCGSATFAHCGCCRAVCDAQH